MSNNLVKEVYEAVYGLMGERTTSTTYPLASTVSEISQLIGDICDGEVANILDPRPEKSLRGGNLKFLEDKVFYKNIKPSPISEATSSGVASIKCVTTDFPASGGDIYINGEIAHYTAKTSTHLTGVTGITTDHKIGSLVYLIHQLPESITKPFQAFDSRGVEIEPEDFRYNRMYRYYSIITDSNDVDYVFFGRVINGNCLIKYYKAPPQYAYPDDEDEEIILPKDAGVKIVAPIIAGKLKYQKGEEVDIAINNLNVGYAGLGVFFNKHSKKTKNYAKGISVPMAGDPTLGAGRGSGLENNCGGLNV